MRRIASVLLALLLSAALWGQEPNDNPEQQDRVARAVVESGGEVHRDDNQNVTLVNWRLCEISDTDLPQLAALPQLTHLNLAQTAITDEGIKQVAKLQSIGYLVLRDTQITDAGLQRLHVLSGLDSLDIRHTDVTQEGVKKLKAAMPVTIILAPLPVVRETVDELIIMRTIGNAYARVYFIRGDSVQATRLLLDNMSWKICEDRFQLIWQDYSIADRIVEAKRFSVVVTTSDPLQAQRSGPWWNMFRNMRDLKHPEQ